MDTDEHPKSLQQNTLSFHVVFEFGPVQHQLKAVDEDEQMQ